MFRSSLSALALLLSTIGASLSLSGSEAAASRAGSSAQFCVFIAGPDGKGVRFVTRGFGSAWSPRGANVAVGLVDATATQPIVTGTRLTRSTGGLIRDLARTHRVWLDEKRLLVSDPQGNRYAVARLDGTLRKLRPPAHRYVRDVRVARTARLIVFDLQSRDTPSFEEYRRLAFFDYEGRLVGSWRVDLSGAYSLSPDARRIAISSEVSVAGRSTEVQLRDGSQRSHLKSVAATELAWSPNSRQLAVALVSDGSDMHATAAQAGLYVHDVSRKSSFRRIVRGNVDHVDWSPNGNRIAYKAGGGLFTVAAAGGATTRISVMADGVTWSPDGKWLTYAADGAIFTALAVGGKPVQITPNDGYVSPTWSPDGTRIAFTRDRITYSSASECPTN